MTFYSPGTFVAEQSTRPIGAWDVDLAIAMSCDIKERHGARPYGFRFTTRARSDEDLDSKEVARSPMHYLGGKVETIEEVRRRARSDERTLLSNMEMNGWGRFSVGRAIISRINTGKIWTHV